MATDGYGTLFQIGTGTTSTYVTVAEVSNIDCPEYGRTMLESTNMDSPSGHRQYIYGLAGHGEANISIMFAVTNTTHQELTDAITNKDEKFFRIAFGGTTTTTNSWSGKCLVKGFKPSAPVDGLLTASVAMQVTGVLTVPT